MTDCVFCKIRDGQIPSMKIYEDERTLCIMDINPLNRGHCLVLIRSHAPTIFDAEPGDLQAAITTAQRVARALQAVLKPDGLNMLQANGPAAFQSVLAFCQPHRLANACRSAALRPTTVCITGLRSTSKNLSTFMYALEWARPMNR